MAMQLIEPSSDFAHLKLRANNQALENKRRNEMVNEILRPPPQPFVREEAAAQLQEHSANSELPRHDDNETDKKGKASNPYGTETVEQKAARQQREAEEDIRRFKEERQQEMMAKKMEKKRDLQMLQSYYPWGRPGHGAPLGAEQEALKKRKFRLDDEEQDGAAALAALATDAGADAEHSGLALNRPGHGAPLRTRSGRLVTQLPGDPALRLRAQNPAATKRGSRDPAETLRYKNPDSRSYAKELETHMQQQMQQREIERAHELQEELNSLQYDPFGRPGAGAPNGQHQHQQQLHQRHLRQQEAESLAAAESRGRQQQLEREFEPSWRQAAPYGHEAMRQPLHDSAQHPGSDAAGWYQQRDPLDTQSAPNPRPNPLPPLQQQQQHQHQQQQQQSSSYHPFGRPGAGAPLVDGRGQLVPSVYGATAKFDEPPDERARRTEAAKVYSQELERGLIEQSLNRRLEMQQRRAPVDQAIADQLAQGSVGKPQRDPTTGALLNQHLPSSDVTHVNYKTPRHKFRSVTGAQHLPEFVHTAEGYSSELERAAVERAAARRLDRAREIHEADRHAQAFDRMFGRPGAGAPCPGATKKVNLDRALHNPDDMRNEYKKPVNHVTQVHSTSYVRNPTGSTHGNGYELTEAALQNRYNLLAPYAVQKHG